MKPEQELQGDESVNISVHPSPWSYMLAYMIGALLSVYLVGIVIIIVTELHRRGNRYFVTTDRIVREYRFLKIDSQEATTDLISDVSIDQSVGQRMIGIGDVHVKTASGENIDFKGVKHPGRIKSEIASVKNKEKNKTQQVEIVEDEDKTYCPNCGEEISESSDYCSNCGEKLEEEEDGISTEKLLDQTISEIKDDVKSRDLNIDSIIEVEKENKDRKTLLEWLKEQKQQE